VHLGLTITEVLVATLIVSVSIVGLVSTWMHMVTTSLNTDDQAAAYQCARIVLERARSNGFSPNPVVSFTRDTVGNVSPSLWRFRYFDANLRELGGTNDAQPAPPQGTRFLATTTVMLSPANEVPVGRDDLRTMTIGVTVQRVDAQGNIEANALAEAQTILAQGGI
jgi:type II secretory pathway pseudopilin PulG